MDPILSLSYIAIVLLAGVLCIFVSRALRIPYNLLLLLLGLFLGSFVYSGTPVFNISQDFVLGVGTLALVLLVFDSTSRLKLDDYRADAIPSVRLINMFSLLSLLLVGLFVSMFFFTEMSLSSIFYSFLFAVLVVETDLGSVLTLFKDFAKARARHLLHFLETEAALNTAFVVILPFVVLSLLRNVNLEASNLFLGILSRLPEFLYEIIVAFGVGIIVGIIMLRLISDWYDHHWTPIVLVTAALVAYVFTALIGGNGVVAVAVMGFFYGNTFVSGREQLSEFSRTLSSSLDIIVFVLLGIVLQIPVSFGYVMSSLLLFAFVICVRLLSTFISLEREPFTFREKVFIGVNMPKGFAMATVALVLASYGIFGLNMVLQLAVMMMIYSVVLSYFLDFFAEKFLHEEVRVTAGQSLNVLEMALDESLVEKKPVKGKQSGRRKRPAKKLKKKAVRSGGKVVTRRIAPAKKSSKGKKPAQRVAKKKQVKKRR